MRRRDKLTLIIHVQDTRSTWNGLGKGRGSGCTGLWSGTCQSSGVQTCAKLNMRRGGRPAHDCGCADAQVQPSASPDDRSCCV